MNELPSQALSILAQMPAAKSYFEHTKEHCIYIEYSWSILPPDLWSRQPVIRRKEQMLLKGYGMFDNVELNEDFEGFDIDDQFRFLRKGYEGTVLDTGEKPNTLIVEFKLGRGHKALDYAQIELEVEILKMKQSLKTQRSTT